MKLKMNWGILGYVLAGIAMLIVLLYLRFPEGTVKAYIKAAAAVRYPRMLLSIDTVQPAIPPGVALENITTGFLKNPEAIFHADRLTVRPGLLSLFRGRLAFILTAEGYGGVVRGRFDFADSFSFQGPLSAEANFREIRIGKCAWLRDLLGRRITGTLEGTVSFSGNTKTLKNGTGNLAFTLSNGTYPLVESFFGINQLDFNKVDAKIYFRNGALKIAELTLNGDKIRCSMKGNILLAEEIQNSPISLNGTIEIPTENKKRIRLAVNGTLGNPKTKFL
jgi:type II secretion system protein N